MDLITLKQIEKAKESACQDKPGSYHFLRNLCKRYIEQETNKAPYGQKTKTKKRASNAATKIVKGTCWYAAGRIFYKPSTRKSKKKSKIKMKNKNTGWLIFGGIAVLGVGVAVLLNRDKQTPAEKRTALINWVNATEPSPDSVEIFRRMTDSEIESVYEFVFEYLATNRELPVGSRLHKEIQAISFKYIIFT